MKTFPEYATAPTEVARVNRPRLIIEESELDTLQRRGVVSSIVSLKLPPGFTWFSWHLVENPA